MKWISKSPPIYIRLGDEWFNETNGYIYRADIHNNKWKAPEYFLTDIPFPPKTKIMGK
jgi:hypothetical protein